MRSQLTETLSKCLPIVDMRGGEVCLVETIKTLSSKSTLVNCSQATAVGIRAKFKYNAIVLV